MDSILAKLGNIGIIPVVAIEDAADAADLGRALMAGNLPCAEITFRTAAAAEAIKRMTTACPDMAVGAGTVLSVDQAKAAQAAGATFIVTPGFDEAVVDWCLANDMPITPGVMTPTEINMALNKAITLVKLFPAEVAGGVKALKAMGGPFGDVRFMPTGGININNLAEYISLPMVHACGGSWLTKKDVIARKDFAEVTRLSAEAVAIVKATRKEVAL